MSLHSLRPYIRPFLLLSALLALTSGASLSGHTFSEALLVRHLDFTLLPTLKGVVVPLTQLVLALGLYGLGRWRGVESSFACFFGLHALFMTIAGALFWLGSDAVSHPAFVLSYYVWLRAASLLGAVLVWTLAQQRLAFSTAAFLFPLAGLFAGGLSFLLILWQQRLLQTQELDVLAGAFSLAAPLLSLLLGTLCWRGVMDECGEEVAQASWRPLSFLLAFAALGLCLRFGEQLLGFSFKEEAKPLYNNIDAYIELMGRYSWQVGIATLVVLLLTVPLGVWLRQRRARQMGLAYAGTVVGGFAVGGLTLLSYSQWEQPSFELVTSSHAVMLGLMKGVLPLREVLFTALPRSTRFGAKMGIDLVCLPLGGAALSFLYPLGTMWGWQVLFGASFAVALLSAFFLQAGLKRSGHQP